MNIQMTKQELRKQYKMLRRSLSKTEMEQEAKAVMQRFLSLPEYQSCSDILLYISQDNEVDTIPILQHAKEDGKRIAVPKVYGSHMHFHQIAGLEDLKPGAYGILEPEEGEIFQPEHGIILVPGIVFDEKGHRIGYGGGYYDRYLAHHWELLSVALAYDYQVISEIVCEEFDKQPDIILTASKTYKKTEQEKSTCQTK